MALKPRKKRKHYPYSFLLNGKIFAGKRMGCSFKNITNMNN
jgi:hypothetical protein